MLCECLLAHRKNKILETLAVSRARLSEHRGFEGDAPCTCELWASGLAAAASASSASPTLGHALKTHSSPAAFSTALSIPSFPPLFFCTAPIVPQPRRAPPSPASPPQTEKKKEKPQRDPRL